MIKKIIFLFVFFFFSNTFAQTETIQGTVKYNDAAAKIEAYDSAIKKIEKEYYKDYLKDKNYKENLELISKNIFQKDNRTLCPFYLKSSLAAYSVSYQDKPLNVFYYNIFGHLVKFDITDKTTYPRSVRGYSRYGNLINAVFDINGYEQFIYDEKGRLSAHWTDNEMKDKNNTLPRFLKLKRMEK